MKIKTFDGSQKSTIKKSAKYLAKNPQFVEESSNYEQGRRGLAHVVFALIVSLIVALALLVVGIISPIAMGITAALVFIIKPAGKLTVKYTKAEQLKTCPKCAEQIKQAATVCRFCNYDFQVSDSIADQVSDVEA